MQNCDKTIYKTEINYKKIMGNTGSKDIRYYKDYQQRNFLDISLRI